MSLTIKYADKLADYIEEGYDVDIAINKIFDEIKAKKLDLKLEKVIKEFKMLYGHDPYYFAIYKKANSAFRDLKEEEDLYNAFIEKQGSLK